MTSRRACNTPAKRYYDPYTHEFVSQDPIGFAVGDTNLYRRVGNSPLNATDPTGQYIESALDIASLTIGVWSLYHNLSEENYGWAAIDAFGIVVDVFALALPIVPGGAGVLIKASRAAATAADGAQILRNGGRAGELAQTLLRTRNTLQTIDAGFGAYHGYNAYQEDDMLGATLGFAGLGVRGLQGAYAFHRTYKIVDTNPGAMYTGANPIVKLGDLRIERRAASVATRTAIPRGFDDISNYRRGHGLPDFDPNDPTTGTVARIDVNGHKFFGENGASANMPPSIRRGFVEAAGHNPANRATNHAEAISLMEAGGRDPGIGNEASNNIR